MTMGGPRENFAHTGAPMRPRYPLRRREPTATILPPIAQFQCLIARSWKAGLVYLAETLRYNPFHEIADQEPMLAIDFFAGRLTAALEACVEVGKVSPEGLRRIESP